MTKPICIPHASIEAPENTNESDILPHTETPHWDNLGYDILALFAERQRLAPVALSVPKYLRVTRPQAEASYWRERRASGTCQCGLPCERVNGQRRSRCAGCAAKRRKPGGLGPRPCVTPAQRLKVTV